MAKIRGKGSHSPSLFPVTRSPSWIPDTELLSCEPESLVETIQFQKGKGVNLPCVAVRFHERAKDVLEGTADRREQWTKVGEDLSRALPGKGAEFDNTDGRVCMFVYPQHGYVTRVTAMNTLKTLFNAGALDLLDARRMVEDVGGNYYAPDRWRKEAIESDRKAREEAVRRESRLGVLTISF